MSDGNKEELTPEEFEKLVKAAESRAPLSHQIKREICDKLAKWYIKNCEKWSDKVEDGKFISWAALEGIELFKDGRFQSDALLRLFALATLWNSMKYGPVQKGLAYFRKIRDVVKLDYFEEPVVYEPIYEMFKQKLGKLQGFDKSLIRKLTFITNKLDEIKKILNEGEIGSEKSDIDRFTKLIKLLKRDNSGLPLKVKVFFVFREIRCQNREQYNYSAKICCVPDKQVRKMMKRLRMYTAWPPWQSNFDDEKALETAQEISKYFCTPNYELFDMPLFRYSKYCTYEKQRRCSCALNEELEKYCDKRYQP